MTDQTPASWASEVHTVSCAPDTWTGNGLRFATKLEADQYGQDLAIRWTAVEDVRSVESADKPTHRLESDGRRVSL